MTETLTAKNNLPTTNEVKKPDYQQQKKEMAKLHDEIDKIQSRLSQCRDTIAKATGAKTSGGQTPRKELFERLQELKLEQAQMKQQKKPLHEELSKLTEDLKKKIGDQKTLSSKSQFKSSEDLNKHIAKLEAQVESGKLRVVDEKKIIQEISQLKKSKRSMSSLQSINDSIESNKKRIEELRELLKDPKAKELSDEFTKIQNELNCVVEVSNKERSKLSGLFDKKNALKKELDELFLKRKQLYEANNKAHKEYQDYLKNMENAKEENEKLEADRDEKNRLEDMIHNELELAKLPAYREKIKLCDVLVAYLSGDSDHVSSNASVNNNNSSSSVVQPDDSNVPQGKVLVKEFVDEFSLGSMSSTKKNKKKKGLKETSSSKLKIPLSYMEHFWELDIKPPSNNSEVRNTIDMLNQKKQWFIDNQDEATEKNKVLAQQKVEQLEQQFKQKPNIDN